MTDYIINKLDMRSLTPQPRYIKDEISGYTTATGSLTDVKINNVSVVTDDVANITTSSIIDMLYPVGCYYETSDSSFHPTFAGWPGTWALENPGLVHVSAGTGYDVNDTGGANAILYTPQGTVAGFALNDVAYWPSHTHSSSTVAPQCYVRRWGTTSSNAFALVGNGGNVTITQQTGSTATRPRVTAGPSATSGWWQQTISEVHKHSSFGASSPSTHTHTATGTSNTVRTVQPFITVNRWHRLL